jgi:UDP-N-acetyl-alpha-D-muramoyl-L-alanyl-L-glutamate epimerase
MSEYNFTREAISAFHFVDCQFDAETGTVRLDYAFNQGGVFSERITFPGAPFALTEQKQQAVTQALRTLHLIAGVSYYKAAVPENIIIDGYSIDAETAKFLTDIYENGLGEFAYRNGLSLRGKIRFPVAGNTCVDAPSVGLDQHALVAIGGGKDSLVSIESLRRLNIPQSITWIGSAPLIRSCAERTGLPLLNISRQLPAELFEMNKQGALNGHIPVTAVNSAILVLSALLQNANQVVFSNERSASYGSLIEGTGEVNHQWSKGWSFERDFAAHVKRTIAADLHYYSLLRPFSELAVARQFAKTDFYDAHFSSCNRNFHILGERPAQRWSQMPFRVFSTCTVYAEAALDGNFRS